MAWWTAIAGGALGKALGKVIDWIPGREEKIRRNIDKLSRERDEIIKKMQANPSATVYWNSKLDPLLERLRVEEEKLKAR